ncbi:MAG: type II toxin-antitoxin system HicB family antitoxin [Chloroflexi bacterium]|nr:type II toxin-antitoxin system HicB family antitoxin [Chloroflexota bacterium]
MQKATRRKTHRRRPAREFTFVIERDEDGWFVGTVPQLRGCYTQARSIDELTSRIKEMIALCLEEEKPAEPKSTLEFVGLQRVAV